MTTTSRDALLLVCVFLACIGVVSCLPTFADYPSFLQIREDIPSGGVLHTFTAIPEPIGSQVYVKVKGGIQEVEKFDISETSPGSNSWQLTLKPRQRLDKETKPDYNVLMWISDQPITNGLRPWEVTMKDILIFVVDVNDEPPAFKGLPYRVEVIEDQCAGPIFTVQTTDPDLGTGGIPFYTLVDNKEWKDKFEINSRTGVISRKGCLDYETFRQYEIIINATDNAGNLPYNYADPPATLIINVKDVADTPPTFIGLPYAVTVTENLAVGSSILTVRSEDGDRQVNTPVKVNFYHNNAKTETYKNLRINPSTGEIVLTSPLDSEASELRQTGGILAVPVIAYEDGSAPGPLTTATAQVTITATDVNDESPTFFLDGREVGAGVMINATVQENVGVGFPVSLVPSSTKLSVRDFDQGISGEYELLVTSDGSTPLATFSASPRDGFGETHVALQVNDPAGYNHRTRSYVDLVLVAREKKTPERRASAISVRVNIEKSTGQAPEFDRPEYRASIDENSPPGTKVVIVKSIDKNSAKPSTISYRLKGGQGRFRIDSKSGEIFVNVSASSEQLDREKTEAILMTAEAFNTNGLHTSVPVKITLFDENDVSPTFTRAKYIGFIQEGASDLEVPVELSALDGDATAPNNHVTYSLTSLPPGCTFNINSTSGVVGVASPLDYETLSGVAEGSAGKVCSLTATATDGGSPPRATSVGIDVTLLDINDQTPRFTSPSYNFTARPAAAAGFKIGRVSASDGDKPNTPNSDVFYRLKADAPAQIIINSVSGELEVAGSLSLDRNPARYSLTVLAIDKGAGPKTGTASVYISVTDENRCKNVPPKVAVVG